MFISPYTFCHNNVLLVTFFWYLYLYDSNSSVFSSSSSSSRKRPLFSSRLYLTLVMTSHRYLRSKSLSNEEAAYLARYTGGMVENKETSLVLGIRHLLHVSIKLFSSDITRYLVGWLVTNGLKKQTGELIELLICKDPDSLVIIPLTRHLYAQKTWVVQLR